MTTEELRQYSAEEIMGWHLCHEGTVDVYRGDQRGSGCRWELWRPEEDYDQLRQVEEKVGHEPVINYEDGQLEVEHLSPNLFLRGETELPLRLRLAVQISEVK